ncbi:MAG: apolipoprotein N-acyltransferase, partial [Planctomycetota bacterium]|nr:apolipoprotein N-acyltransferase [Planctomycetota bacterium]
ASYGSVWLASFLVVMFAAALATLKSVKPQTWFMFFGLWLLLALFTEVSTPSVDTVNKNLAVAIVQTNVPQDNKIAWTWDRQQKDVANAIELTYEAVKHATEKPELVVWPETMLPGVGLEVDRFDFAPWEHALTPYWQWGEKIRKLASEINIPILVGSQTWIDVKVESDGEKLNIIPSSKFNSAVLVFPDGRTNRYDKTFLTPFGERIPYFEHLEWLNRKVRELVGATMLFDLDQGDMPNYLTIPELENEGSIRIGTPICFEDTVPSVVRNLVWEDGDRRVGVLINLSNDGWFGDADDARLQHIREARMRCIENRTPMIRVANTGMSCLINATGQVSQYAMSEGNRAIRKTAFGLFTTPQGFVRPLSARIGDGVAWICLFASILFISISGLKRSSIHAEKD